MIKYLVDAVSKGLSFSKTEALGTLVLFLLMLVAQLVFTFFSNHARGHSDEEEDYSQALRLWVEASRHSVQKKEANLYETTRKGAYPLSKPGRPSSREVKNKVDVASRGAIDPVVLDINASTAEGLQQIKGIGKVLSKRIVTFRDLLGGFDTMDQLYEVYGLTDEVVEKIKKQYDVLSEVSPLNLNADSAKHLARHPYINYDLAWIIINYRNQNGDLSSVEELSNIKAINDSILNKLRPYLN